VLDTVHSLKRRVRKAQKDKLALREDLLAVRRQREQVALRADAVREKHEAESTEMLVCHLFFLYFYFYFFKGATSTFSLQN
jgi:hypothetical protein